ncbi:MAG: serine/threonine protein phosphatase [Flavobacteriaceae bacterium]|nr:serine/threonine protein phosphatase [Flavobacteriaceae bacterium]|tara:strand:- start:4119 stop:4847 length:729 start_codon:yes stop_codon:yes gene_type:complete
MKTYAIGDIHGGLKALVQVLNKLELQDGDRLIFMGDYVDGWSESAQAIQFLIELSETFDCIFIKGNHDIWCENWLRDDEVNPTWYMHGGKETMDSYEGFSASQKKKHLQFFQNMPLYHIDEQNRLFIHAGFTSMYGVKREYFEHVFTVDRTLWEMALAFDSRLKKGDFNFPKRLEHYHEIYIGHTPTTNFGFTVPMNAANVWNVDTGAAFKGRVSGMNIDTKSFVQSDNLPSLYPYEKGRNK